MTEIKNFFKHYLPNKLTLLEKYTIEHIYDRYDHLMPLRYICKNNKTIYGKFKIADT